MQIAEISNGLCAKRGSPLNLHKTEELGLDTRKM